MARKPPRELKIVKASNNLIEAHYKNFTLGAKQVLWHIAARLQEEGYTPDSFQTHNVMTPYETIQIDLETGKQSKSYASKCVMLVLDIKRLTRESGMSYSTIRDTIQAMKKANLWIISKDARTRTITSLFPTVNFEDGENKITVYMWADILLHLLQLQIWTQMDYHHIMRFKSVYTLRTYELLSKVKNQDYAVFTKTLSELNEVYDTKYKRLNDIVANILIKAKEELDENSKISFEYTIKYLNTGKGRPKANEIQFFVTRNSATPNLF